MSSGLFNGHTVQVNYQEGSAISKEQIEAFKSTMHGPNNRPVQPVNSRVILQ